MKYQMAVQNLKTANHQYATRQVTWVRNRLLQAIRESKSSEGTERVDMYLLDTTGSYSRLKCDHQGLSLLHTPRASKMDIRSQRRGSQFDGRSVGHLVLFINHQEC